MRLVFARMIIPYIISFGFALVYISMQTMSIYAGDSGELVTAAYTWSIAHPPGYPLYMILGGLFSQALPFYTVPWRVGLLSSIPMALSIYFVWHTVYLLSKSKIGATASSLFYGLLYPVWLYAIVPEVFGLFALFSSLILYVFLRYLETKQIRWLFLLTFLFGLSFTHHHLILFLLLSIGIFFGLYRKSLILKRKKHVLLLPLLFLLGFSIYVYAPIASSHYPPIDWEHPASPIGFFRMITRSAYGTFRASLGTGESLMDRGFNVLTLGQYMLKDFSSIGILFFLIGIMTLWRKNKSYGVLFLIYLGWQFFYFFYTGFSLSSDFALGTLERFFVIPYQIISILVGVGVWGALEVLKFLWQRRKGKTHIPLIVVHTLVICISLVIPIQLIKRNYIPLKALQNDTTLEKLADDIFKSTPTGSILNLSDDTSVFAVLYGYYVQKKRQDIRFVMFPQFKFSYYVSWLKRHYSDVAIPSTPKPLSYAEYLKEFFNANYPIHPIMNERIEPSIPDYWVPRGLLVMYYERKEELPSPDQVLLKNNSLWSSFQDPFQGVIGVYRHLMLSDVLRYYSVKRLAFASFLLYYGQADEAQKQALEAIHLTPTSLELFTSYIDQLIDDKHCQEAQSILGSVRNLFINQKIYLGIYHRLYEACPDLEQNLQSFEKEYQEYILRYGEKIEE